MSIFMESMGMNIDPAEAQYRLICYPKLINDRKEMESYASYIPWMTYREGFKSIGGYETDTGWGCMIRVAQMMLAYTLMRHFKHKMDCSQSQGLMVADIMKNILPLFLDNLAQHESPFSIQNIIKEGEKLIGRGAGEWYGAHSISQVIKTVNENYNMQYTTYKILTFNDGIIYKNEIDEVLTSNPLNGC